MPTSLSKGYFQNAYVTTDLDRAIADFGTTYGVHTFLQMRDVPFNSSDTSKVHIALAYIGDDMIELIQPEGDIPLYNCLLQDQGYGMRFHHRGHLLGTEADWESMQAEVTRQQLAVSLEGTNGMFRYLYADTRSKLGHFLEFIYCTPEGTEFFAQVPRN